MTIIPFDRRTVRIWEAEGVIPDDLSTREHDAQMCARLLREYDALTMAGVIADDARIVAVGACKVETAGWTGAQIVVREHPTFDTEPSA